MPTRYANWVPLIASLFVLVTTTSTEADFASPPGSASLSFGMTPDQTPAALGAPLSYVLGQQGQELMPALPNVKGSALSSRSDGIYLQFRKDRLAGWKGNWGTFRR